MLATSLISCGPNVSEEPRISEKAGIAEEKENTAYNLQDHNLTTGMYLIRDDLYRDKKGDIFFRMLDIPDTQDNARELIYKKRFGLYDKTRSGNPPNRLRDVIDSRSWRQLTETLYSDKNYLYCYHYLTGGGWIAPVENFDPKALKVIVTNEGAEPRLIKIQNFEASNVASDERAWHFTDGLKVIDYRCCKTGTTRELGVSIITKKRRLSPLLHIRINSKLD